MIQDGNGEYREPEESVGVNSRNGGAAGPAAMVSSRPLIDSPGARNVQS